MLVWRGTTLFARLTHTSSPGTVIIIFFCARPIGSVVEPVQSWPTPVRLRGKKFVEPVKDYYFTHLIDLLFVVCVKIAIFD